MRVLYLHFLACSISLCGVVNIENTSICKVLRIELSMLGSIVTVTELSPPAKHFACVVTFPLHRNPWRLLLSFYPPFYRRDKLGLERCCDLLQAIELTVAKKAWTAIRFVLLQSSHGAVSPVKINKLLSSVAKNWTVLE